MSTYFQSIQIGVLLFFVFLMLALIPYMIIQYRRHGRVAPWRFLVSFSFVFYLICAYALTIFPLPNPALVAKFKGPEQNLVPFLFVREFIKESPLILSNPQTWLPALKAPSFIQPAFNLLMTVPFGLYLRYLFKKKFSFSLIVSFLLTLSFESIQRSALFGLYPRPYRLFDVDDLMLNTLGAMIGFGLAYLLRNILPSLEAKNNELGKISFTRRNTGLFIDFMLSFLVAFFMKLDFYPVMLVVFLLIPLIFKQTIGQMILRIQILPSHRLRIFLRQLISLVNALPLVILLYLLERSATIPKAELASNFLLMLLDLGLIFLPVLDMIFATFTGSRKLWYESLTKTSLAEKNRKV